MINTNLFSRLVLAAAMIPLAGVRAMGETPWQAGDVGAKIQGGIPAAHTLEAEITLPVALLLPGQGNTTRRMRMTVNPDELALVWTTSALPTPKYFPPGTGGYQPLDYDSDGNLVVSMWQEGAMVRDEGVQDEYAESTGFRVALDGTVRGQVTGSFLRRYPPAFTNTEGGSMYQAIRRSLGRPPAEDFSRVLNADYQPDGTYRLRAAGQSSEHSGFGVWTLTVDPANGELVRSGVFGPEEGDPMIQFRTEDVRRFGDVIFAQRGDYSHGPQRIEVRLISFSPKFSPELVAEARRVIARAETRLVQVFDYREDPSHPTMRVVQAGELRPNDGNRPTSGEGPP
jgi:hypothetical protein